VKEHHVEVKIGVQFATRELVIDSPLTGDEIEKAVSEALTGDSGMLLLNDSKGRRVIVPREKLAYVELGSPTVGQVGFRS
jgi:Protein of unknown function (DUF3107)